MIGFIEGRALNTGDGMITICTDGSRIGYEVHVSDPVVDKDSCMFWIHEVAPQDAPHELYGFRTREERDLFRRLLEVKGVGPKVAQRIIANKAVTTDNVVVESTLRAVRGVGTKLFDAVVESFK